MPTEEDLAIELTDKLLAEHDPDEVTTTEFLGAQFDAGLAWVWFPKGHGGLGAAPGVQAVVEQRLQATSAPNAYNINPMGVGMAAPTIVTHASDALKHRLLRPLFTGEELWCQMFSEPGAGSDVASLAARAERDGDEWVVNGQKVWTSIAHLSSWGLLLTRTDPDVPKHRGMTYFVVDMHSPGVEVRQLRQLTGDAEFNEVFFNDVRIPDSQRLGDVGQGWGVALTTLMNERYSIAGNIGARGSGQIGIAVRLWHDHPERQTPAMRARLMRLWVEAEVNRLTAIRAKNLREGGEPGPQGSIGKLARTEINQRISEFCVDFLGPYGQLYDSFDVRGASARLEAMEPPRMFLRNRASTLEGGTSEIQRNILGERVLGLPGDVRVDRDLPWKDVLRS